MEVDLYALLKDNPMLLLLTVIGLGYLAGNIRIAGVQAGPVIGVLTVGLFFGASEPRRLTRPPHTPNANHISATAAPDRGKRDPVPFRVALFR